MRIWTRLLGVFFLASMFAEARANPFHYRFDSVARPITSREIYDFLQETPKKLPFVSSPCTGRVTHR